MRETKPIASLSSGLLARKGMAKPAMRPQGFGHFGGLEDLGWNDMGQGRSDADAAPERRPSPITALTPGPVAEAEPPVVVEQQRDLANQFGAGSGKSDAGPSTPPKPQAVAKARKEVKLPRSRVASGAKAKAAFTLRLDPERHLRLRLACALTGRSAQVLVTEALDTYLEAVDGLDDVSVSGQSR